MPEIKGHKHGTQEPPNVFDSAFAAMEKVRGTFTPQLTPHEVGTITSIATGIAKVSGLPGVGFDEFGDVFPVMCWAWRSIWTLAKLGVVLLGEYWHLHAGDEVQRTGRVMDRRRGR